VIGSTRPGRSLAITNAWLVAFFDHYVKGVADPVLSAVPLFPEAQVTSKP
jgi:hypothetical protein